MDNELLQLEQDEQTARKRSKNTDRSGHQYSEQDFRQMPRTKQYELANEYWLKDDKYFDASKMFQFSFSHFTVICKELGFSKDTIIVDTKNTDGAPTSVPDSSGTDDIEHIYIHRNKREAVSQKKFSLSASTLNMFDELFKDADLDNREKSKIVDAILFASLQAVVEKKNSGRLVISYPREDEERIL